MVVGPSKTGKSQFAVGMMKRHGTLHCAPSAVASSTVPTPVLREKYTAPVDQWFFPTITVSLPLPHGFRSFKNRQEPIRRGNDEETRNLLYISFVVCGGFDLKGFDCIKHGGIVLNDVCGIDHQV
jgi:hypothetical protein